MITHLVQSNSEINVKLIGIIRSIELGHYELPNTLINNYILSKRVPLDSKLALLFEIINNNGYHSSIDPLIEEIINGNIDQLSLNDKYTLLGIFYQIKNIVV